MAISDIDPQDYELIISGVGVKGKLNKKGNQKKKIKFTLEDLKNKFENHEVVTMLQCVGNQREDLYDKDYKIFIAPHWVIG